MKIAIVHLCGYHPRDGEQLGFRRSIVHIYTEHIIFELGCIDA